MALEYAQCVYLQIPEIITHKQLGYGEVIGLVMRKVEIDQVKKDSGYRYYSSYSSEIPLYEVGNTRTDSTPDPGPYTLGNYNISALNLTLSNPDKSVVLCCGYVPSERDSGAEGAAFYVGDINSNTKYRAYSEMVTYRFYFSSFFIQSLYEEPYIYDIESDSFKINGERIKKNCLIYGSKDNYNVDNKAMSNGYIQNSHRGERIIWATTLSPYYYRLSYNALYF